MKHPARFCSWLTACSVALSLLAVTADAGQRQRSALADVSGLDELVTLSETKIPLGELVRKVAAATGVPLAAARNVANEPVAVVVSRYPARDLLKQVAGLLDYRWSRRSVRKDKSSVTGYRYEIWQDLAGKQREEALHQAMRADVEKRFREELQRYVEMASLSQEQIQAILDAPEKRRDELKKLTPEQRETLRNSPAGMERT